MEDNLEKANMVIKLEMNLWKIMTPKDLGKKMLEGKIIMEEIIVGIIIGIIIEKIGVEVGVETEAEAGVEVEDIIIIKNVKVI